MGLPDIPLPESQAQALALILTGLLTAWGLWEVHAYVKNMPDGS